MFTLYFHCFAWTLCTHILCCPVLLYSIIYGREIGVLNSFLLNSFLLCLMWCRCVVWTGDGRVFFYNPSQRMSLWERPEELQGRADVEKMVQNPPDTGNSFHCTSAHKCSFILMLIILVHCVSKKGTPTLSIVT